MLLDRAQLEKGIEILDVGCGLGGTSRFLARNHHCHVTGITISAKQVEMAIKLSADEVNQDHASKAVGDSIKLEDGSVRFLELDAERMAEYFPTQGVFDCVWISEAMSHLPDKQLFFQNAMKLLRPGGKLVVADWFRADDLTSSQLDADIKPIEGMASDISLEIAPLADVLEMACFSHHCVLSSSTDKSPRELD